MLIPPETMHTTSWRLDERFLEMPEARLVTLYRAIYHYKSEVEQSFPGRSDLAMSVGVAATSVRSRATTMGGVAQRQIKASIKKYLSIED